MQSALQVFFVGMSVYGWLSWTRSADRRRVARRPVAACLAPRRRARLITLLSFVQRAPARRRNPRGLAAARFADHLVQPARHLARGARQLENWLYWIVIDGVLVFLFLRAGTAVPWRC